MSPEDLALVQVTLERTRIFAELPRAVRERLRDASELRCYRDNKRIARYGDPSPGVLVVAEGCIVTSRTQKNGQRHIYDFLQPGQVTGIFPTFDGGGMPLDATARGPTKVVIVASEIVRTAAYEDPEFALSIIAMLCRRSRVDYEARAMNALDPVRVRIAKLLLYMTRGPQLPPDLALPVRMSQEDLAAHIGISRQSANKELVPLFRDGTLMRQEGKIVVADVARLLAVAQENGPLADDVKQAIFARAPELHRTTD
jgi:CRP-like cAMP-binding protein